MACPFPDGSGSAVPAQQPATDPTQRHKPDVRWSRPLMAWIYLGRRKQIRVLKDVPRCREEPRAQRVCRDPPEEPRPRSKVATRRLRGLSSRLSGPIGLSRSPRMGSGCPPRSVRCPRRAQDAPAERKVPPQSASPLFKGEQKKTFSRYSPNILHSVLISHGTQHRSIARLRSRSVHAGRASQRNTRASAREARRPRCHRRSRAFPYSQPRCPRRSRRCAAAAEPGGPCRWCFAFVAV
jgi:hypothetical protein